MTYKECIKNVKGYMPHTDSRKEIIRVIEKQIPKRLQSRSAVSCYCGNCHCMFSQKMYGLDLNYCPWCGQMISWVEGE